LLKFAGMGNALTFPVQSIAFAVLSICATLDHDGLAPSYWNIKRSAESIQCFGDDIIVKTEYYHTVRRWIESFGLKVNDSKTFSSGNFRESCGLDAYRGYDVTPVYYRVDPTSASLTTSDLSSLVATSNQLWLRGLYSVSNAIREHVEKTMKIVLPLVHPDSGLLGWHDRYGSSYANGWHSTLHYLTLSGLSVTSKLRDDKIDDRAALLKFFMTSLIERRHNHMSRSTMRYNSRIVKKRVPAYAG